MAGRRLRVGRIVAIGLLVALLGLGGSVVHDTWFTRLNVVQLTSAKVSDQGLRVAQITDFHSLEWDSQVDQVVDRVRQAQPDVVAITGDLVTTVDDNYAQVERLFAGLMRTHKNVFVVWGNHDHWNASRTGSTRLRELIEQYRLVLLDDSAVPLDGPWGSLDVIGTDDYFVGRGDLDQALGGTRPDAFRLVLTHSPDAAEALRGSGVDLAICGHTHGGQIRVPIIGALYIPGEWFPQYSKGWYDLDGVPLYIDSGVGTTGPRLRVFNPSQVTVFEITNR